MEATGLRKLYRRGNTSVIALDGLTLSLGAGACVALVGPSGCGKSTLLHLCGGMDHPTAGEVRLEGRLLSELEDDELTRVRRERIGFVFQSFHLLPTLTVAENIGLPLLLSGETPRSTKQRVLDWAERVGVAHRLEHLPPELSGGEAQRVAIARALVHDPVLVLADEPTGSLDRENGLRILNLLRTINRQSGVAMLLATHDVTVATAADRVVEMCDGRILSERVQGDAPSSSDGSGA